MDSVSSQYDEISDEYDILNSIPSSQVEVANALKLVKSLFRNEYNKDSPINALDLACGTGRFTRFLLQWGATSVLGVDLSAPMIELGKKTTDPELLRSGKIDFQVGDGSKTTPYPKGPFDFVFGAWLHACAADKQQMLNMWENVALNLKPGCYFVGVTPPPSQDPKAHSEMLQRERPNVKGSAYHFHRDEIADGVIEKVVFRPLAGTKEDQAGRTLELETFHLRKSVWEDTAKEAGFETPLGWKLAEVPEELVADLNERSEDERLVWESLKKIPQMAFVIARKL